MKKWTALLVMVLLVTACARNFNGATSQNFTLGAIQMKIHKGMSQGEVA